MIITKYKNISASTLIKTGPGVLRGIFCGSASGSPSVRVGDGVSTNDASGDKATQVLTIGTSLTPGKHAKSILTSDATNVVDGATVTIGSTVYRYKDTMAAAYDVKIGASAQISLANLRKAINATGTPGTEYFAGTLVHPTVVASASDATTLTAYARIPGTAANTIATTETSTHLAWEAATLGAGTGASVAGVAGDTFTIKTFQYAESVITSDATNPEDQSLVTIGLTVYKFVTALTTGPTHPYEVLIGATASDTLDNLKSAINATAGTGTTYSSGTPANSDVTATTKTSTTLKVVANTAGTGPNTLATTETSTHLSWADTTLGGGTGNSNPGSTTVDSRTYTFLTELSETQGAVAIADQILWVTSDAVALDNMKVAINAGATVGTNYSTGTVVNALVSATTNTNTAQTVEALTAGALGNTITVTETSAGASWGADTLTGGADAVPVMVPTYTPVAGVMQIFGDVAFATGLYVTVAATCDLEVYYD